MAEGGALLRRYGGTNLHRGFESLLLRFTLGGVAERSNAAVSKTVRGGFVPRGFKSLPLRSRSRIPLPWRDSSFSGGRSAGLVVQSVGGCHGRLSKATVPHLPRTSPRYVGWPDEHDRPRLAMSEAERKGSTMSNQPDTTAERLGLESPVVTCRARPSRSG